MARKNTGTQVQETTSGKAEVTQAEAFERIMSGINGVMGEVAGVKGSLADLLARVDALENAEPMSLESLLENIPDGSLVSAPVEDAEDSQESQAPVLPNPDNSREYRVGEREFGVIRKAHKRTGLDIPAQSLVTVYEDAEGEQHFRIWVDHKYRTITQSWAENKANVRRLKSVTRRMNTEHRKSAKVAKGKALAQHILGGQVTFEKGSSVQAVENPKTGATTYVATASDGKTTRFVKRTDVQNGKLAKTIEADMTHLPKRLRKQVERHNDGACSCDQTKNWLCPAAQALGPDEVTVGAVTYNGSSVDISGAGATLLSRINKAAWGIES